MLPRCNGIYFWPAHGLKVGYGLGAHWFSDDEAHSTRRRL